MRTLRRSAISTLALLDPFCAVLRFPVAPIRSENRSLSTHAQIALLRLLHLIPFEKCCASSSRLPGQRIVSRKKLSTHAQMRTYALAILDPFCAVLRFLVAPTRLKNSSLSTHAQMRTFRACYTWSLLRRVAVPCRTYRARSENSSSKKAFRACVDAHFRACYTGSLLRSVADPCRSHLPVQRTVRRNRFSMHAQMRTAALAILDPFCAALRSLAEPTRSENSSPKMRRCALPSLAILDPFCKVLRFLVAPIRSEDSSPKMAFHACADAPFRVCYA